MVIVLFGFLLGEASANDAIFTGKLDSGTQSTNRQQTHPVMLSQNMEDGKTHQPAANDSPPSTSALMEELKEGFGFLFKGLAFGTTQKPSDSNLNPENAFLEIPRYTLEVELRPDFSLDFRNLSFLYRPRYNTTWLKFEDGTLEGETDTDDDLFTYEWLARLRAFEGVYLSYGRENLQWGPSFLISPSNPFFRDNGTANPKMEVPSQDFGRFVWVINFPWTASFIANTDKGRQEFPRGFEPAYAVKLDWTGNMKYASLIGSVREGDRFRLGGFAGWTATEGLLLYAEAGDIAQGSDSLYPVEDPSSPFGIALRPRKEDSTELEGVLLLGASYTFALGPNIAAEYVYNSLGYNDKEAELYFELQKRASDVFFSPNPLVAGAARQTLGQALDPGLRLLRQHYLMFQFRYSQIYDVLNIVLRYTYNIDDSSNRLIPILEYDLTDYLQFFAVGSHNFGPDDSEAKLLVDYSWQVGIEYTF